MDCPELPRAAWVTAENALCGPGRIGYLQRPRLWRVPGLNDPRLFRPILIGDLPDCMPIPRPHGVGGTRGRGGAPGQRE